MDSFLERGYAGGLSNTSFSSTGFVAFGDVRVGAWTFEITSIIIAGERGW